MAAAFDLILEYQRPVAAIIAERLAARQLKVIYALLPAFSINQPAIAERWNAALVLAQNDWASEQLKRVPMLPPKGIHLCFVDTAEPAIGKLRPVQMDIASTVIKAICQYFDVTPCQLESSNRSQSVVWPRFFAMGLIREFTKMPTEKIGYLFNRDHSTILHALKALKDRLETSPGEAKVYSQLQQQLHETLGTHQSQAA